MFSHGGHTHLGGGGHGHSHGSGHSSKGYENLDNAESGNTNYHSYGSIQEHSNKKKEDSNINVKAAFVHVMGDLIQSIGVLIAAFIIYFKVRNTKGKIDLFIFMYEVQNSFSN